MSLAIVIPTYNEAENIVDLINEVLLLSKAHLIIVDDSSPDGTSALVSGLQNNRISLITRKEKLGLGSAYREGFDFALKQGYTIIGQMDADFSHQPESINELSAISDHNTLVLGSRYSKGGKIIGWNLWRHFCSKSAMITARLILGLKTKDVTSGFRFWSAELLAKVLGEQIASTGYAFQEEMLFHAQRLGAIIRERPIIFVDRKEGASKLGRKDILEFFLMLYRLKIEKMKK